jgi:hypothetical protein
MCALFSQQQTRSGKTRRERKICDVAETRANTGVANFITFELLSHTLHF